MLLAALTVQEQEQEQECSPDYITITGTGIYTHVRVLPENAVLPLFALEHLLADLLTPLEASVGAEVFLVYIENVLKIFIKVNKMSLMTCRNKILTQP